jgi:hypothetical protein
MGLPWKKLAAKAFAWLLPRIREEVEKEVEKRQGDPLRRTGLTPPPSLPARDE